MLMMKRLFNKRRAGTKIDTIFKEDDTILDIPRLALLAINNGLMMLKYKRIYYVVRR
jgi:hypothetical protein